MSEGSVTRASRVLRTSKPTVSRELAAFEWHLDLSFSTGGRSVRSLPRGPCDCTRRLRRSYSGLHQLSAATRTIRDTAGEHIQIACPALLLPALMPSVCERVLQEYPASRISLRILDHPILMRRLLGPRYELGIVKIGVAVDGVSVEAIPVSEDSLPHDHDAVRHHRASSWSCVTNRTVMSNCHWMRLISKFSCSRKFQSSARAARPSAGPWGRK